VTELAVPSDDEVQARKVERMVTRLAAEGLTLPLEDFAEFGPVARRILEHEHRDHIVATLLREHFQPPPVDEAEDPLPLPPSRERERERDGGFRRHRRRR